MSTIKSDTLISWQSPVIVGFAFNIFLLLTLIILYFEAKKKVYYKYKKSDFIFLSN